MALIDKSPKRFDIPHELGEWVELRLLSGAEMDSAQESATAKMMARMTDILSAMKSVPQTESKPDDSITARRIAYDPTILLGHAVLAWSYGAEVNSETVGQLDAVTRDWLWETIVEENTRPPVSSLGGEPA